jgi:hypothetical protein
MKKISVGLVLIIMLSCNSNSSSTTDKDTTITNVSGVENVNGNIPDTTNTIKVEGSSQSSDPTNDSLQKQ